MKKKAAAKTNAMRHLDTLDLPYTAHDLQREDVTDGMSLAALMGRDPQQVFKTLVTQANDQEYLVFMVPVCSHLSLKKAAKAAGVKSVEMIPLKTLFPLTGYVHGGCSPLGMKKQFRTFLDETAVLYDTIYFSGGKLGVQIEMAPDLLADHLPAAYADLCE